MVVVMSEHGVLLIKLVRERESKVWFVCQLIVLGMVTQLCFVASVSLCSDRTKELLTDDLSVTFRHPGHKLLCCVLCCYETKDLVTRCVGTVVIDAVALCCWLQRGFFVIYFEKEIIDSILSLCS